MKIHCAELVEGALRSALEAGGKAAVSAAPANPGNTASNLLDNFSKPKEGGLRVILLEENKTKPAE